MLESDGERRTTTQPGQGQEIFREAEPKDYGEISRLYRRVWGQTEATTVESVRWAYDYAAKTGASVVVEVGGRIVAARYALEWQQAGMDGERYPAVQCGGTAVDPAFRRQGMFSRMTQVLNRMLRSAGFAYLFNVSVPASRAGNEKLGWQYESGLRRYFSIAAATHRSNNVVEVVGITDSNIRDVIYRLQDAREEVARTCVRTHWSSEFLEWRLLRPGVRYLVAQNESGQALIYREGALRGRRVLLIGAHCGPESDRGGFRDLLAAARATSHIRLATAIATDAAIAARAFPYPAVRDPRRSSLNLGVKVLDETLQRSFTAKDGWCLSQIDIDTF